MATRKGRPAPGATVSRSVALRPDTIIVPRQVTQHVSYSSGYMKGGPKPILLTPKRRGR